jgi:hypothetical protein
MATHDAIRFPIGMKADPNTPASHGATTPEATRWYEALFQQSGGDAPRGTGNPGVDLPPAASDFSACSAGEYFRVSALRGR